MRPKGQRGPSWLSQVVSGRQGDVLTLLCRLGQTPQMGPFSHRSGGGAAKIRMRVAGLWGQAPWVVLLAVCAPDREQGGEQASSLGLSQGHRPQDAPPTPPTGAHRILIASCGPRLLQLDRNHTQAMASEGPVKCYSSMSGSRVRCIVS